MPKEQEKCVTVKFCAHPEKLDRSRKDRYTKVAQNISGVPSPEAVSPLGHWTTQIRREAVLGVELRVMAASGAKVLLAFPTNN
jgi:hypothetical protein